MSEPHTEPPEDKAMQDHTFGRTVAERAERAERGDAPTDDDERPTEHHAGGKA